MDGCGWREDGSAGQGMSIEYAAGGRGDAGDGSGDCAGFDGCLGRASMGDPKEKTEENEQRR